jgi:hypothetical protein
MLEVLALQSLESDDFDNDMINSSNSGASLCCAGCNSAASTGGCGSQQRL